jgi:hypothetical protein
MPVDHPLLVEFFRDHEEAAGAGVLEHRACTNLVSAVVDAVLVQMGETPPADSPVVERIALAVHLEPARRDRFYTGHQPMSPRSMLPELSTVARVLGCCTIEGDAVVLPDITPFEGWAHLSSCTHRVAAELLASVTPATPPPVPIEVDFESGHELIVDVLDRRRPTRESVATVFAALHAQAPSERWAALARLPYEEEHGAELDVVAALVERTPPDGPLRALWFGIQEIRRQGELTYDLVVMGSAAGVDDGMEWLEAVDWRPSGSALRSEVAHQIHRIAHPHLGRGAELAILLHACLTARALTEHHAVRSGRRMQAAASFVGGGEIGLGWFGCDVATLSRRRGFTSPDRR